MSLNEVMTCVRENIPAIAVVFNNEQWGAEKKNQVDFYKDRFVGTNLVNNPSFAEISRTMGAEGIKVTNPDEIGDALNTLVQSGKPGKKIYFLIQKTKIITRYQAQFDQKCVY